MGRGATVRRMLAASAVVLVAGGCASGTDEISTAGVDELVIPTPSPDPDDFVAAIDNPWLPWQVGAVWTYETDEQPAPRLAITVTEGPEIAGVATTAVRSVNSPSDDGVVMTSTDYYAQDADGNVWWFGREGEWQAGVNGAEAGIAMLAKPRVGDGYAEMGIDGEPGQRSVIEALEGDELVVETTTPAGVVVTRRYERGTGLVQSETPEMQLGLVDHDAPQP